MGSTPFCSLHTTLNFCFFMICYLYKHIWNFPNSAKQKVEELNIPADRKNLKLVCPQWTGLEILLANIEFSIHIWKARKRKLHWWDKNSNHNLLTSRRCLQAVLKTRIKSKQSPKTKEKFSFLAMQRTRLTCRTWHFRKMFIKDLCKPLLPPQSFSEDWGIKTRSREALRSSSLGREDPVRQGQQMSCPSHSQDLRATEFLFGYHLKDRSYCFKSEWQPVLLGFAQGTPLCSFSDQVL